MNYKDNKETSYAIISNYSGYSDIVIAKGLDVAIKSFLMQQRIITSLFPSESLIIVGQDGDNNMPLLTLFHDEHNILSMQGVSYCDGKVVADGRLERAKPTKIIDECQSFIEIASKLNQVFELNKQESRIHERFDQIKNSRPALHLTRDYFKDMLIEYEENTCGKNFTCDPEKLSNEIDNIRLSYSATVEIK